MTKNEIISALAKLGNKIVKHRKFGDLIEMDPEDAFFCMSINMKKNLVIHTCLTPSVEYLLK